MPELPEAETIARQLHSQLAGRILGAVDVARIDIIKTSTPPMDRVVPGRCVLQVRRRAKRVVIELNPSATIVFGLGMTGRITIDPIGAALEKHTHLRIAIPSLDAELRFRDPRRFGGVWVYDGAAPQMDIERNNDPFDDLGVEPLTCTSKQFQEILGRKRQIKALLMDQHAVAGLGNIYCDESLHAARIHPLTRADRLAAPRGANLLKSIKSVLRRAIRFNGSTLMDYRDADGAEGSFQRHHRVYGREGQPCKECGAAIKRIVAAGRSTHFCPRCQKR